MFFHLKKFCLYYGRYDRTIDLARELGVTGSLRPFPSMALGAFEATLLEIETLRAAGGAGGLAERLEALAGRAPVHEPRRLRLLAETEGILPALETAHALLIEA